MRLNLILQIDLTVVISGRIQLRVWRKENYVSEENYSVFVATYQPCFFLPLFSYNLGCILNSFLATNLMFQIFFKSSHLDLLKLKLLFLKPYKLRLINKYRLHRNHHKLHPGISPIFPLLSTTAIEDTSN